MKRYNHDQMLGLYEQWQVSGKSKPAFAEAHGIRPSTFYYWIRKFERSKSEDACGFDQITAYCKLSPNMNRLFTFILFMGFSISSISQNQIRIAGEVKSKENSEPVPFCHIYLSGTNYGTVSDNAGHFVLMVPYMDDITLHVSAIGYQSKSFVISDSNPTLLLSPSTTLLDEVIVTAPSLEPEQIVRRAFRSIRRNYIRESIVLESFYRHVCRDDDRYGRIIDAQVDIYKKRGYGRRENYPNSKDQFRVNEERRSFDQSHARRTFHRPMALDILLKSDIAALKQKRRDKKKSLI